jgi:hypothetical protein
MIELLFRPAFFGVIVWYRTALWWQDMLFV